LEQALARKATASKDKAIREMTQGTLGNIRSLRELAIRFFFLSKCIPSS